jgi:uncharacterized protein YifN (PemK superfamily)
MPHALRVFKMLKAFGMPDERALCIAGVVEEAKAGDGLFRREKIIDDYCDSGVREETAEVLASAVQNCFLSQRFLTHFDRGKLKFHLVRAKETAAFAEDFLTALEPSVVTLKTAEVRVPIQHAPSPGRVVMCDFSHLRKPEMQKERRAIVVSTKAASGYGRCTVVPVSMKSSVDTNPHHYEFSAGSYRFFSQENPVWAVCDHMYTVSLERLWVINIGLKPDPTTRLSPVDFDAVLTCLGTGLTLKR